jgi:hypothetical protein
MLKIRGISNAEHLLTGVKRFAHCLTLDYMVSRQDRSMGQFGAAKRTKKMNLCLRLLCVRWFPAITSWQLSPLRGYRNRVRTRFSIARRSSHTRRNRIADLSSSYPWI